VQSCKPLATTLGKQQMSSRTTIAFPGAGEGRSFFSTTCFFVEKPHSCVVSRLLHLSKDKTFTSSFFQHSGSVLGSIGMVRIVHFFFGQRALGSALFVHVLVLCSLLACLLAIRLLTFL
jgi:hypothetical protein